MIQRCPRLAEAARAGELITGLSSLANERRAESEFLLSGLEKEVVAELDTPWAVSVKKWRCGERRRGGLVVYLCFSCNGPVEGALLLPLLALSSRDWQFQPIFGLFFSGTRPP